MSTPNSFASSSLFSPPVAGVIMMSAEHSEVRDNVSCESPPAARFDPAATGRRRPFGFYLPFTLEKRRSSALPRDRDLPGAAEFTEAV